MYSSSTEPALGLDPSAALDVRSCPWKFMGTVAWRVPPKEAPILKLAPVAPNLPAREPALFLEAILKY